ncbi:MAG TPA: CvpA family protein, partial [Chitinophagaceae bacterium]
MNWVDVTLLIVVLLAIWSGWNQGFILGILDLINWVGSILLGFLFYAYLANFLKSIFPALGVWLLPLSFIIT